MDWKLLQQKVVVCVKEVEDLKVGNNGGTAAGEGSWGAGVGPG